MRIAIGADHAGFHLKETLIGTLRDGGHDVVDVGTDSDAAVDYPDFTETVALAVRRGGRRSRGDDLRKRRRRERGSQQGAGRARRRLPRFLFGAPGCRAR